MMVGELDQGWKILMGAIDFERAALASPGLVNYQFDRLLAWCAHSRDGSDRPIDDPSCRTNWCGSLSRRKARAS